MPANRSSRWNALNALAEIPHDERLVLSRITTGRDPITQRADRFSRPL
jgi:hypothetical protein